MLQQHIALTGNDFEILFGVRDWQRLFISRLADTETVQVRAGSSYHDKGGQLLKVKSIHQHPDFDYSRNDYDIAILELDSELKFSDKVQAINLPDANDEIATGALCIVSGWGSVTPGSSKLSPLLQAVAVPVISNKQCEQIFWQEEYISERMLCAGFIGHGGSDACQVYKLIES